MDSEHRPSAEQLLRHPFLAKAADHLAMPKVVKKKKDEPADNDPKPTDGEPE